MTVGGMGFIPERLLMMMMMIPEVRCVGILFTAYRLPCPLTCVVLCFVEPGDEVEGDMGERRAGRPKPQPAAWHGYSMAVAGTW